MFFKTLILSAFIAAALALAIGPTPHYIGRRLTVRRDTSDPPGGCVDIPIASADCLSFTGGLSFFNDEVSSVNIPAGFHCSFFDAASCISKDTDTDAVFLHGGAYNFSDPGSSGNVDLNDRASSFRCRTFQLCDGLLCFVSICVE
ncbi:hypothetical protein C8J57DRAFT_1343947 [Mycena rebaudengoi]|nr:hypothetical protein C8J57DRAFT_1343947 [Mycena rebaudengoi]